MKIMYQRALLLDVFLIMMLWQLICFREIIIYTIMGYLSIGFSQLFQINFFADQHTTQIRPATISCGPPKNRESPHNWRLSVKGGHNEKHYLVCGGKQWGCTTLKDCPSLILIILQHWRGVLSTPILPFSLIFFLVLLVSVSCVKSFLRQPVHFGI